ncbi:MAG TPA: alternative ribosome rescue aminoacyl-tRNA hydrolase ArfB [Candidatus Krumholzibacteria bacterium]|nr:alternative ribosome rescue aminoacyl-tRNA hydrolase ArfB [Candidatus Krumholzibacteria bacterium]
MASDDLPVSNGVTIPADELAYAASRSSGPGGQHVNTADTRIQLRWNPGTSRALTDAQRARVLRALASRLTEGGEIILASDAHRSQRRNREEVRQRLAQMLREALVPPKPRKATRPTASSRARRLDDKRRRGEIKKGRGKPED